MTFRVDGVSYPALLERAYKSTKRTEGVGESAVLLSIAEWERKCVAMAREQFATAKRRPLGRFDTPAAMKQFLNLCASRPNEFRELVPMELYFIGRLDPKTKEPLTAWRTYTGAPPPDFVLTQQAAA